jgi:hypothetical protein
MDDSVRVRKVSAAAAATPSNNVTTASHQNVTTTSRPVFDSKMVNAEIARLERMFHELVTFLSTILNA